MGKGWTIVTSSEGKAKKKKMVKSQITNDKLVWQLEIGYSHLINKIQGKLAESIEKTIDLLKKGTRDKNSQRLKESVDSLELAIGEIEENLEKMRTTWRYLKRSVGPSAKRQVD